MAEKQHISKYRGIVILVISLLVAFIVIVISIVYILQKIEIELVYSVFVLILVGISLWILRHVIKMAETLDTPKYREIVISVISLLVAFIIVIAASLLHILQKIEFILQGKEIELVYSVLALLLVVITLGILRHLIKIVNIRIIITEKLRIRKKELKKVVHSLIGLILSIIIAIIAGHGRPEVNAFLIAFLIFITVEILYVVYFNFPAVESLIHRDIIVESIEGEDAVFKKQLEVINMAEKGDVIYGTTCNAPFKKLGDSKYYKLKDPCMLPEWNIEWEAYKRLHERVVAKEIKLRRLAPLIYLPDEKKNKENEENIGCISEWFEQLYNDINDKENPLNPELYKLRYTIEPYYRRMLYLEPKDTNRPSICILGTIGAMPLPKDYYGLYIQSKALRETIGNEIKSIFENSEEYNIDIEKNLLQVLHDKIKKLRGE